MANIRVRVPQIVNLEAAVKLYYSKTELNNCDIRNLFDCATTTATKLKKVAMELQISEDVPIWNAANCNTECAFRAWGLDIAKMERNLQRLKKLNLED